MADWVENRVRDGILTIPGGPGYSKHIKRLSSYGVATAAAPKAADETWNLVARESHTAAAMMAFGGEQPKPLTLNPETKNLKTLETLYTL